MSFISVHSYLLRPVPYLSVPLPFDPSQRIRKFLILVLGLIRTSLEVLHLGPTERTVGVEYDL